MRTLLFSLLLTSAAAPSCIKGIVTDPWDAQMRTAGAASARAQVALAWLLSRGDDVVPIPGTTKAARLEENAGAAFVGLSAADLAQLADAVPPDAAAGDRYPTGMMALVDE